MAAVSGYSSEPVSDDINSEFDRLLIRLAALEPRFSDDSTEYSPLFNHCCQSVEYSISGYPQHKSELFKATAGRLAWTWFSLNGEMRHDVSAPVPGAPLLDAEADTASALARLVLSLREFKDYRGDLKPHFAYGTLTHQQYSLAHLMHINDHLRSAAL